MKHHPATKLILILHQPDRQGQPQPDTQNKKTLLWRSSAVGLLAGCLEEKTTPQHLIPLVPPELHVELSPPNSGDEYSPAVSGLSAFDTRDHLLVS